jgi:hypothetical protein
MCLVVLAAAGCGGSDDPYKTPASEIYDGGRKANMPAVPTLPNTPVKSEGNFTIYGASHHLRSTIHNKDVTKDAITIVGYIVKTNIADAPPDCQHPQGKEDGPGCKNPDVPSFWIADNKDAGNDPKAPKIRIVRWARNYAVVYDAIDAYSKLKPGEKPDKPVSDPMLGIDVPFPLPAVGAKVKVTGKYSTSGMSGRMSDPVYGIMDLDKMETVELAPAPAAFGTPKK